MSKHNLPMVDVISMSPMRLLRGTDTQRINVVIFISEAHGQTTKHSTV